MKNNKLINDSVLITLHKISENKRRLILEQSALEPSTFNEAAIKRLEQSGFIREIESGRYVITALGIQEIEKADVIKWIDEKDFNIFKFDSNLNDSEKVILFAMIAGRAFNKMSAVNMKFGDTTIIGGWRVILEKCNEYLNSHSFIKLPLTELFKRKTSDDPVAALFRYTFEGLPKKTKHIFKSSDKRYYLNLYEGDHIDTKNLAYIFHLLFEESIITERDEISKFCRETFRSHYTSLYYDVINSEHKDLILIDHRYISEIDLALEMAILL